MTWINVPPLIFVNTLFLVLTLPSAYSISLFYSSFPPYCLNALLSTKLRIGTALCAPGT